MTQTQDRAVVDTNIISYLLKGDVKRAALYKTDLENRQLIISFVTVAELFVWAYSKGWASLEFRRAGKTASIRSVSRRQ